MKKKVFRERQEVVETISEGLEIPQEVVEEIVEVTEPKVEPKVTTLAVDMSDMDMYISGKKKFATIKEQQDLIKKAKTDPAYNTDANYRDKVNKLEVVKSTEAINAAKAEQLKKAQAVYSKLSKIDKANYLDEHPEYDSVDGKLKYKSK